MKILQLVSSFGIGGAEKFVADLSVELKAQGHEVTILVLDHAKDVGKDPDYEKNIIEYLNEKQVQVIHVGEKARRRPFTIFSALNKTIKNFNPDIIHSHLLIWSVFLSVFWRKRKHIFTQHTNALRFPFIHKVFVRKGVDRYISICDDATISMRKTISHKKIIKVVNGISLDKFTQLKINTQTDKHNFVTVSRLCDEKNHHLIIDAVDKLVNHHKQSNFLINVVGEGPLKNELKAKIERLSLKPFFKFHGVRKDIPYVLATNDVFLLPSKDEGFSIALIEALIARISIIASDVGANHEILLDGKYGQLIEKNSCDSLVSAMLHEIMDIPNYEYDTDEFRSHIQSLSINSCAANHVGLYQLVCSE